MKKLIIVTGVSCSGKTTYTNVYSTVTEIPVLHFDDLYEYANKKTNYSKIKECIDENEVVILDAIMFGNDLDLSILRSHITDDVEIQIDFIYGDIKTISQDQLHRSETSKGYDLGMTDLDKVIDNNTVVCNNLNKIMNNLLKANTVTKVKYIYRKESEYKVYDNDKDLLNKIGETNE